MKASRIQAVEMARRIRDRQLRRLAGKMADDVIAPAGPPVKPPWKTPRNERSRAAVRPDDHLKDS